MWIQLSSFISNVVYSVFLLLLLCRLFIRWYFIYNFAHKQETSEQLHYRPFGGFHWCCQWMNYDQFGVLLVFFAPKCYWISATVLIYKRIEYSQQYCLLDRHICSGSECAHLYVTWCISNGMTRFGRESISEQTGKHSKRIKPIKQLLNSRGNVLAAANELCGILAVWLLSWSLAH